MSDPEWRSKLSGTSQYSTISNDTRQMLWYKRPRSIVYSWYGKDDTGVDNLGIRISRQLGKELGNAILMRIPSIWPTATLPNKEEAFRSFDEMILAAFQASNLDEVVTKIGIFSSRTRCKVIVHIKHEPIAYVFSAWNIIHNIRVKQHGPHLGWYLEWLSSKFNPILRLAKVQGLVSLPYITNKPDRLHGYLDYIGELDDLNYYCLKEVRVVNYGELRSLFRSYGLNLTLEYGLFVLEKSEGKLSNLVYLLRNTMCQHFEGDT